MMQALSPKKIPVFLILGSTLASVFFMGCSMRLASQEVPQRQEASFLAMGSKWTVAMSGVPSRGDFAVLKDKLISFALYYEMTFSSWSEESELRRLERDGLDKTQSPSELFFEGLRLSQEAFGYTGGVFDITVGAIEFKALPAAVGLSSLEVDPEKKTFRFKRDPKRLTFDGIVKGMALGEMASYLIEQNVKGFVIDAGGGNLVERTTAGQLSFVSRSRIYKAGSNEDRHIWNPRDARYVKEKSEVVCKVDETKRSMLVRWGGLSDAFSKATLLSSDWQLPPICEEQ
ncbi:MAG: FAD:protein FMN transferase [Bdellovibrionota bacterium]